MKNKKNFLPGYLIGGTGFMIIFPLVFYFISAKIGSHFAPFSINDYARVVLAVILIVLGLWFSFWSIFIQRRVGQGGPLQGGKMEISPRTKKLNTTGPYRYSRNPMLFGTCAYYFSLALFLNSPTFFFLSFLFTILMTIFVKKTEEKRLLADFGEEYESYRRKTSFFIPFPPKI